MNPDAAAERIGQPFHQTEARWNKEACDQTSGKHSTDDRCPHDLTSDRSGT
jgi:hypothetical protein